MPGNERRRRFSSTGLKTSSGGLALLLPGLSAWCRGPGDDPPYSLDPGKLLGA